MAVKSILILNHSDSHTHTHTQYGPTQLCTACREALIIGVMDLFFSLTAPCNTLSLSHTQLGSGLSRGTQPEQTGQNLGHADSQVVQQFLPVRQYSQSLHDFHGTFYTGFHLSTSGKCVTGRKTLGFFVNHVNIILLRCPPLQAIATIPPWSGE